MNPPNSGRLVMRGEDRTHSWQVTDGNESMVLGVERHLGRACGNGVWLRETQSVAPRSMGIPKAFHAAQRRWRLFLDAHGIRDFQMKLEQKTLRILGPPPRFYRLLPEWRLSIVLPSRQFRTLTLSHTSWGRVPPDALLMSRYAELLNLSVLKPEKQFKGAVMIEGDQLLQFLVNTLDHTLEAMTTRGKWHKSGGGSGLSPSLGGLESHLDLLPETRHFIPFKSRSPEPDGLLRAVAYDMDQQLLIGVHPAGCRAIRLEAPLYRLIEKMSFGGKRSAIVLKGVRYQLPRGFLFLPVS